MNQAKFFKRHIQFAAECIAGHTSGKPFPATLSAYFRANKKFGSKDRRSIRALTYGWFRLGYALPRTNTKEQIQLAYLTLTDRSDDWLVDISKELGLPETFLTGSLEERLTLLAADDWQIEETFPLPSEISERVDRKKFFLHTLAQPLTWVRPSSKSHEDKFEDALVHEDGAFGYAVGTQFGKREYQLVVQDLSSQQVLKQVDWGAVDTVWDCCCASGGKSLYLCDNGLVDKVLGSDIRQPILENFQKRLRRHKSKVATAKINLMQRQRHLIFGGSNGSEKIQQNSVPYVVADVPCSGSGTWNRNPEFKYAFQEERLKDYHRKQRTIVANAWPFLAKGGRLLYLTCSVYAIENEGVIEALPFDDFEVIQMGYVNGYTQKSDSMFFCEIRKLG